MLGMESLKWMSLLFIILAFNRVSAEEIELKSGEVLHGEIHEQNFESNTLVLDVHGRKQVLNLSDVQQIRKGQSPKVTSPPKVQRPQPQAQRSQPQLASHGVIYTFSKVGYYLEDIGEQTVTYEISTADFAYQYYWQEYFGLEVAAYLGSGAEVVIEDKTGNGNPSDKLRLDSEELTPYDDASLEGARIAAMAGWGLGKPGVLAYIAPGAYVERVKFEKTLGGSHQETVAGLFAKFAIGYSWKHFATGFWGNFRMGAPDGFKPNRSTQGGWMFSYRF